MRFLSSFFFLFFSYAVVAENIATIRLSYIIENTNEFVNFLEKLNKKNFLITVELQKEENRLAKKKQQIEESQMILSQEEYDIQISLFNSEAQKYQIQIDNFNTLINENIEMNKKIILEKIYKYVQEISAQSNFILVFNEDQYFLASNTIDISNLIVEKLNIEKFKLEIFDKK